MECVMNGSVAGLIRSRVVITGKNDVECEVEVTDSVRRVLCSCLYIIRRLVLHHSLVGSCTSFRAFIPLGSQARNVTLAHQLGRPRPRSFHARRYGSLLSGCQRDIFTCFVFDTWYASICNVYCNHIIHSNSYQHGCIVLPP